ncbi:MAG: hypothetical protein NT175_10060 [Bacteroidetes bacterium]|nr:hypothetical protein [Bacteroidota bacterium]
MKPILITILFSFNILSVFAQEKSSFVAVRSGVSCPLGAYYSADLQEGSFTMAGFNATLEGAWFFKRWLGVGASAGLNLHPIDAGALATATMASDAFMTNLSVRSDPFRVLTFMAGPYACLDLRKNFSLTCKLLGGMIQASTPYQLYKAEYFMIGRYWYEITSSRDWEVSFMAGIGVRYDVSDCIGIMFDTDFTYNQCEFGFITYNGSITEHKKILFLNSTLGIIIIL